MSPLLSLLHLCDSLFPLGAFAHSDGLEAATASGGITDGEGLRGWMEACLEDNLGGVEGPAVLLAWRAFTETTSGRLALETSWADVLDVDAEVHALRPSLSARQASRAMGTRLLKTWLQIHQTQHVDDLKAFLAGGPVKTSADDRASTELTLPVAFGLVCASSGIEEKTTVEAFMYTRLAATASCAMRVMSIGQHEAHALLASTLARVTTVADRVIARGARPAAFMPAMDITAMSHQYVHSRLFRS